MFKECTEPRKKKTPAHFEEYDWRDTCEDGSDFDIDPEDYETEEEYEEALEAAKCE